MGKQDKGSKEHAPFPSDKAKTNPKSRAEKVDGHVKLN